MALEVAEFVAKDVDALTAVGATHELLGRGVVWPELVVTAVGARDLEVDVALRHLGVEADLQGAALAVVVARGEGGAASPQVPQATFFLVHCSVIWHCQAVDAGIELEATLQLEVELSVIDRAIGLFFKHHEHATELSLGGSIDNRATNHMIS